MSATDIIAGIGLLGLLSVPISLCALAASRSSAATAREALAVSRSQLATQAEALLTEQRRLDAQDTPEFEMVVGAEPRRWTTCDGELPIVRWPVRAQMVRGPRQVRVRWRYSADVRAPQPELGQPEATDVELLMNDLIGTSIVAKGAQFCVMIECPQDTVELTSCTVTVHCEELDVETGEDTGRTWVVPCAPTRAPGGDARGQRLG